MKNYFWIWCNKIRGCQSFTNLAGAHSIELLDWLRSFLLVLWSLSETLFGIMILTREGILLYTLRCASEIRQKFKPEIRKQLRLKLVLFSFHSNHGLQQWCRPWSLEYQQCFLSIYFIKRRHFNLLHISFGSNSYFLSKVIASFFTEIGYRFNSDANNFESRVVQRILAIIVYLAPCFIPFR